MPTEYYYEEDYPDCLGEEIDFHEQPGCLTCLYKRECQELLNQRIVDSSTELYNIMEG